MRRTTLLLGMVTLASAGAIAAIAACGGSEAGPDVTAVVSDAGTTADGPTGTSSSGDIGTSTSSSGALGEAGTSSSSSSSGALVTNPTQLSCGTAVCDAGGGGGGGGGGGLHAEQHYEYHQPLKAGDVLTATTKPGASYEKEGRRGGKLLFSESVTEYRNQKGELVVTAKSVGVRTERPADAA